MDGVIVDRVGSSVGNWLSGAIVVVCNGKSGRLVAESWVDGCRLSEEGCAVDVKALYQSGVVMGGAITDVGNSETDFVINSIAVVLEFCLDNRRNFGLVEDILLFAIDKLPALLERVSSLARKQVPTPAAARPRIDASTFFGLLTTQFENLDRELLWS